VQQNSISYLANFIFQQIVNVIKPELKFDDETKLMSPVNGDSFIDMKQEKISEPFSFVTVKVSVWW
jgi:hypothetical protein